MFFRMLKKDLKDKPGLNVTLFIFVVLAAILVASGTVLLYARIGGDVRTYESCNTSDLLITLPQNQADKEAVRNRLLSRLEEIPEMAGQNHREVISILSKCIGFENVDAEDNIQLKNLNMILSEMPTVQNLPYDMEDEPFFVENGCVAIPQNLKGATRTEVGDTIKITTQMGNVYEFQVSVIYKEPSAEQVVALYFSPGDFEVLRKESPMMTDLYEVQFENVPGDYVDWMIDQAGILNKEFEEENIEVLGGRAMAFSDDGIIGLVVAVVMMIVAVFMILMIFITIGFTLKSAIKREEKEIGMMKAIGAYSLSYQALFAAKYLAFAVVGGLIGLPIAMPLTRKFISAFLIHIRYPDTGTVILLSVSAVLAYVFLIIGFVFLTLRRMNKITVMDAIHGENKGERFHKIPGFYLHKRKHMRIPLFLAVSDIFGRLRRYLYLILAYVMGIGSILLVVQMRDSVVSVDFMQKYMQKGPLDFVMRPDDFYMEKLHEKYGSYEAAFWSVNENFEKNGIPAEVEYFSTEKVTLSYEGREYVYFMLYGEPDTKEVVFQSGNAPQLKNEAAIPCYQAENAGIGIGDTISIEYKKIGEDGISNNTVKEDFIVTALFDSIGGDIPDVIMGNEFEGAVAEGTRYFSRKMNCAPEAYDYYFQKMDELYEDDEIGFMDRENVLSYFMGSYELLFDMMLKAVAVIVGIVIFLLTVLYQSIFMEEETGDIAMLKSMGFTNGSVRMWYYLRIILLLGASFVAAHLFIDTLGHLVVGKLISDILYLHSFPLTITGLSNFVLLPAAVLCFVTLIMLPALKPIRNIQIWRIRNE